jgi:hypothetical protein
VRDSRRGNRGIGHALSLKSERRKAANVQAIRDQFVMVAGVSVVVALVIARWRGRRRSKRP